MSEKEVKEILHLLTSGGTGPFNPNPPPPVAEALAAGRIHGMLMDRCLEAIARTRQTKAQREDPVGCRRLLEEAIEGIGRVITLNAPQREALNEMIDAIVSETEPTLILRKLEAIHARLATKAADEIIPLSLVGIALDSIQRANSGHTGGEPISTELARGVVVADLIGAGSGLIHGGWPLGLALMFIESSVGSAITAAAE